MREGSRMRPPRGAGIIALYKDQRYQDNERLYVCLVRKTSGVDSFPKGHRHHWKGENVFTAAARHWRHETGLSMSRLNLLDQAHVDDHGYGCRYLIANCTHPDEKSREQMYEI